MLILKIKYRRLSMAGSLELLRLQPERAREFKQPGRKADQS